MSRYIHLFSEIERIHPRRIMEIGTWNGHHAREMIMCAQKFSDHVEYYGFDLFEDCAVRAKEHQDGKIRPPSLSRVQALLEPTGARVYLCAGDTNRTLPGVQLPVMDLVFIDGGHSVETIRSDWNHARKLMDAGTVVLFDDYYPSYEKGCRAVVEQIDQSEYMVDILPGVDQFKKAWGTLYINFVRVQRCTA